MLEYETVAALLRDWPNAKRIKIPDPTLARYFAMSAHVVGASGLTAPFKLAGHLDTFEAELQSLGYEIPRP